jgi:hypothetical protein
MITESRSHGLADPTVFSDLRTSGLQIFSNLASLTDFSLSALTGLTMVPGQSGVSLAFLKFTGARIPFLSCCQRHAPAKTILTYHDAGIHYIQSWMIGYRLIADASCQALTTWGVLRRVTMDSPPPPSSPHLTLRASQQREDGREIFRKYEVTLPDPVNLSLANLRCHETGPRSARLRVGTSL